MTLMKEFMMNHAKFNSRAKKKKYLLYFIILLFAKDISIILTITKAELVKMKDVSNKRKKKTQESDLSPFFLF